MEYFWNIDPKLERNIEDILFTNFIAILCRDFLFLLVDFYDINQQATSAEMSVYVYFYMHHS